MKLFQILFLLALALPAMAVDRITATITVTNPAGTTNGQTITVNANFRTWTNSVATPASQILTNASIGGSATNLYNQIAATPYTSITPTRFGTNAVKLKGTDGLAMAVTLSSGWGTVSYQTQLVTLMTNVSVSAAGYPDQDSATNIFSSLALSMSWATSAVWQAGAAFSTLVGTTNTQTITGVKTFSGVVILVNPIFTNAINYGNAFSSPGAGSVSEQFGAGATASGASSLAVGNLATASDDFATAIGYLSVASGQTSLALGDESTASAQNSIAIGVGSISSHAASIAIGFESATTTANQIRLGSSSQNASIPGSLTVDGLITNAALQTAIANTNWGIKGAGGIGTNISLRGWTDITNIVGMGFATKVNTALANGVNAAVDISTNSDITISPGPTAAYTIAGFSGGYPGRVLNIYSKIAFPWTLANESGGDPAPTNRIVTLTGGDVSTLTIGAAQLIYDGVASRWVLRQFSGYGTNVYSSSTNGILSSYGKGTNTDLTTITNHGKLELDQSSAIVAMVINTNQLYFNAGKLGLGTSGADRKLEVLDASNPQMRLSTIDGNTYTDFQTTSAGMLIQPSGGKVSISLAGTAPVGVLDLVTDAPSNDDPVYSVRQALITTSAATVTTLQTIAIAASKSYLIEARVVARRTGGVAGTADDGAVYIRRALVTTKGGTVTINAVQDELTQEDQAGWDCTITVSGTDVLVRVTGATDNNVTWSTTTTVQFIGA